MNTQKIDARLIELETRIAYQEDTIGALNDAIVAQQRQIDRLQAQLTQLRDDMRERLDAYAGEVEPTRDPRDEIPPHY